MAFGPFVRILAQVTMVAGGAIGRAAMEAYKEAAAGRGAAAAAAQKLARRRMSLDEARKVMESENVAVLTEKHIQEKFEVLHKLNQPSEDFIGSPYLQARISAARAVLIQQLNAKTEAETDDKSKAKDDKAKESE
ncbi:unnamed protein product [Polarella glacialis]|uniref:Mitochondrial import inner membrane translocase subunit TIM16 n=1 Tax=Polarella glacialis TaxID=89957 RepID=A0A813I287_POLGL|nr:unnamed protein product [Polarella glacialis]CAE8691558.1 unnamed protein product [Polarella glacialis]|mmetsp:Transcript_58950/g.95392  ORF Transcript_58950/g.95392 Transcript_58950/m.95392 type:complete len:135 (-) Transcript_58950:77-481(-)|eukprot:CAMPEP_0115104878 /NCGR_PEP_ID=MMETSP0227-20121206/35613_1 /TAXON_ID=89957 /ORGANISM="Polarella glacialis, Strain CCMP 1383" /LENGTH=134 /DNA_ID=CAMNT_0002501951 /DNA_START=80 /DNA_END=484 /DNA_ORIENTATION=+